jgi:hypothetical protein
MLAAAVTWQRLAEDAECEVARSRNDIRPKPVNAHGNASLRCGAGFVH